MLTVRGAGFRDDVILESGWCILGRSSRCQVVLPCASVSRRHALVRRVPEGFELLDPTSRNGTLVNGRAVTRELLAHGDTIVIGGFELTVGLVDHVRLSRDGRRRRSAAPRMTLPVDAGTPA